MALTLTPEDLAAIADAVWDEILTAATHNVPTSAGRRLRQLASAVIIDGTAAGPGTGTNQIVLGADASSVDGAYDPAMIAIVNGTGAGQCRLIFQYAGATKTATIDRGWRVLPSTDSDYVIFADAGREHVNEGLARGGTSNTITLNVNASGIDGAYVDQVIAIRSGTGEDQARRVVAYNGTTKIATIDTAWDTTPDTTSAYAMLYTSVLPDGAYALAKVTDVSVAISATVAAAVASGSLAMQTYYTFRQSITSTLASDLSAATKLWLAIKTDPSKTDAQALIFCEKTDGLTVVIGTPYATAANGSITVSGSSGAWVIALYLSEVVTALLSAGSFRAELKAKIGTGEIVVWSGTCVVSAGTVWTM